MELGHHETPFTLTIVDTDEAARGSRIAGSPAFVVDGVDLFESPEASGSVCLPCVPDTRRSTERARVAAPSPSPEAASLKSRLRWAGGDGCATGGGVTVRFDTLARGRTAVLSSVN